MSTFSGVPSGGGDLLLKFLEGPVGSLVNDLLSTGEVEGLDTSGSLDCQLYCCPILPIAKSRLTPRREAMTALGACLERRE
jgi:hypothetical protein